MRKLSAVEREHVKEILYQILCKNENGQVNRLDRYLGNKTNVIDTAYYGHPVISFTEDDEKEFRYTQKIRGESLGLGVVFVIVFVWCLFSLLLHLGENEASANYGQLFVSLIFGALAYLCVRSGFSKNRIIVGSKGIQHKEEYAWPDILGTYIIERPSYDNDDISLVLTLVTGKFIYINLRDFDVAEIAAYVAYYKGRYAQSLL